jgi:hypothetical protein
MCGLFFFFIGRVFWMVVDILVFKGTWGFYCSCFLCRCLVSDLYLLCFQVFLSRFLALFNRLLRFIIHVRWFC